MRTQLLGGMGLVLALCASSAPAQELVWRPASAPAATSAAFVTLGRPQPLLGDHATPTASPNVAAATLDLPRPIYRGQSPDLPSVNVPPPPPPPGGLGNPAVFPGGPAAGPTRGMGINEEAYNAGIVNNNADVGGFFTRCGERMRRCWTDVSDGVTGGFGGRRSFQSDHCFDNFISPVSNPIYFEDPRSLTELRPLFIYQHTRDDNPAFAGGNNFFAVLQGRLALTECVSLVVNKLGYTWVRPEGGVAGVDSGNGFSELHLGPKFTFIRNENTGTVAAMGLNFEIATGSADVFQNTGNLSLSPYFSIAQNFGRSTYGSFNFMNTTGYSLGIDSERSDFFYTSFHLDYDIQNNHKFYPLIELNWTRYVFNGSDRPLDFEGSNLFNFGSMAVAGHDDLTMAVGFRYKFSECVQLGLAGEFSLIGGSRHMEGYRVMADMIFRY